MKALSIKSIMAQATEFPGRLSAGLSRAGMDHSYFEFRPKIGMVEKAHPMEIGIDISPIKSVVDDMK